MCYSSCESEPETDDYDTEAWLARKKFPASDLRRRLSSDNLDSDSDGSESKNSSDADSSSEDEKKKSKKKSGGKAGKKRSKNTSSTKAAKPDDPAAIEKAKELEIKLVDEKWNQQKGQFTTREAELDESVEGKGDLTKNKITIRRQWDRYGDLSATKTFADIKSASLLVELRKILVDVTSVSLHGNSPSIRCEILFHFQSEMEDHLAAMPDKDSIGAKHLKRLIEFMDKYYKSTRIELDSMIAQGEITFGLLWAFFAPNQVIMSRDANSHEPRMYTFDWGSYAVRRNVKVFDATVISLFYDGTFFGQQQNTMYIEEFPGSKKITTLDGYPLKYHANPAEITKTLVERGRKSAALLGVQHREFKGFTFYKTTQGTAKLYVTGRVVLDAEAFRRCNPNYSSAMVNDTNRKRKEVNPKSMTDDEAALLPPHMVGYSLSKRQWLEFPIIGISDISWNDLPFKSLVLPAQKKMLLQALVEEATPLATEDTETKSDTDKATDPEDQGFDDFVHDKGKGLAILLHGSPGVGKTLTAEAISELQRRPLYRVTAGDLDPDGSEMETKMSEIMDLATRWKAILLLDEADVFVEAREGYNLIHNRLVSIFLRQLEYFQGVIIMTTNRVKVIDDAIKSRIHLGIKFEDLNLNARVEIWTTFIERAKKALSAKGLSTEVTTREIRDLAGRPINGRVIKNTVRIAYALAAGGKSGLGLHHLQAALDANEDFDTEYRNVGLPASAANAYM